MKYIENPIPELINDSDYEKVKPFLLPIAMKVYEIKRKFDEFKNSHPEISSKKIVEILAKNYSLSKFTISKMVYSTNYLIKKIPSSLQ